MNTAVTQVLLVDDHSVLRDGLELLLDSEADITVVGGVSSGDEAIAFCRRSPPHVVVIDIGLPDRSGIDVIRALRDEASPVRFVVLSMHGEREFVLRAIEAGADGFVPKSAAHTSLLEAIRTVAAGQQYLHPLAAGVVMQQLQTALGPREQFELLSEREQAVIRLAALGYSSRETGEQLSLSPKTVETYRQRAYEKLNLNHRTDLMRFAIQAGLLDDLKSG